MARDALKVGTDSCTHSCCGGAGSGVLPLALCRIVIIAFCLQHAIRHHNNRVLNSWYCYDVTEVFIQQPGHQQILRVEIWAAVNGAENIGLLHLARAVKNTVAQGAFYQ